MITVSVSDLRTNMSKYLAQVERGVKVLVRDNKRNKTVAQLTSYRDFDPVAYEEALRKASGVFTAERHPEWKTLGDVKKWLGETRANANRKFE